MQTDEAKEIVAAAVGEITDAMARLPDATRSWAVQATAWGVVWAVRTAGAELKRLRVFSKLTRK